MKLTQYHIDLIIEHMRKLRIRIDLSYLDLNDLDLRCADLGGADLYGAVLRGANFHGANLTRANFSWANLHGADLTRANLRWVIGNSKQIKTLLINDNYHINFTDDQMSIGCEQHSIKSWEKFSDDKIEKMHGKNFLVFWRKYKNFIFESIELSKSN